MVSIVHFYSRFICPWFLVAIIAFMAEVEAQNPKGPPPKPGDEEESGKFVLDPTAEVPLTVDLEDEEEEDKSKDQEKERKRNEYFDIKTKKGYTKTGYGNDIVLEQFHYLKEYQEPGPYVRDIYWFHTEKEEIVNSRNIDKEHAEILHGPYVKKTEEGEILEEGVFYKGTKHGRWTKYNKNYILQDKTKYTKGWLRESEIIYYDENEKEKIKEVIPKEYGEKNGEYYYFYENGEVAVKGHYKNDKKVGVWTEYYQGSNRIKKQIQYPEDPFNTEATPFVLKEYNKKGQIVYENTQK